MTTDEELSLAENQSMVASLPSEPSDAYPSGAKLAVLVLTLMASMFLVALDMVRRIPRRQF